MQNVSASGISITLKASRTFPGGITLTSFADDADPIDAPASDVATATMNLNGQLVVSNTPVPITPTIALIPGSEDDQNMQVLYDANRPARGKRVARDVITMVVNYPDGSTATCVRGVLTNGMPFTSAASAGRLKSSTYAFAFEDVNRTRGISTLLATIGI